MTGGVVVRSEEGTPQGGPLSPLARQHPAGRFGQRTDQTRTALRPLCGRLQHLRGQQACRGTGHGIGDPICGRKAETESESGQKRGRPAVEPKVPRLQLPVEQAGNGPVGTQDDSAFQEESPGDNGPNAPADDGRTD